MYGLKRDMYNWDKLSPSDLEINFISTASDLVKDIILSLKKMSLYPPGHRLIKQFLMKPFEHFGKLFRMKTLLSFEINRGRLLSEGAYLRDNQFTSRFAGEIVKNRLSNLIFYDDLTPDDLHLFLDRLFVKGIAAEFIGDYIKKKGIKGIEVNAENPSHLFQTSDLNYFENDPQFTFNGKIKAILQNDLSIGVAAIIGIPKDDRQVFEKFGFDVRKKPLAIIAEDILNDMELKGIVSIFNEVLNRDIINNFGENSIYKYQGVRKFINFVAKNHGRAATVVEFRRLFSKIGIADNDIDKFFDAISVERLKAIDGAKKINELLETGTLNIQSAADFSGMVDRLINGNFWNPLKDLLAGLHKQTVDGNGQDDKEAFLLARDLINRVISELSGDVYENFLDYLIKWAKALPDDPKAAELIGVALRKLLLSRKYADAFRLALLFGEHGFNPVISQQIKPNLIDRNLINQIISDLIKAPRKERRRIGELIAKIANGELAYTLINYIADDDWDLRLIVIKTLVACGEEAIPVLNDFIDSGIEFGRKSDRIIPEDDDWFKIRNIITVISRIKSEKALPLLEKIIDDPDKRLEIEIAHALEHIPGNKSINLLETLYNNKNPEVKEAAVISMGLSRSEAAVGALRKILESGTPIWKNTISALGNIHNGESVELLLRIAQDKDYLEYCGLPPKRFGKIREIALRELEKRGNKEILNRKKKLWKFGDVKRPKKERINTPTHDR